MPDEESPKTDPLAWFGWVSDQWRTMTRSALDMAPPLSTAPFDMTSTSLLSALKTLPDASSFGAPQLMLERGPRPTAVATGRPTNANPGRLGASRTPPG